MQLKHTGTIDTRIVRVSREAIKTRALCDQPSRASSPPAPFYIHIFHDRRRLTTKGHPRADFVPPTTTACITDFRPVHLTFPLSSTFLLLASGPSIVFSHYHRAPFIPVLDLPKKKKEEEVEDDRRRREATQRQRRRQQQRTIKGVD